MHCAKILKAGKIYGKTLVLRDATVSDAEFIFSLRTNAKKSKYISTISDDLEDQKKWLIEYQKRTDQAYFIIEDKLGMRLGTVRLYGARDNVFCWGSWILSENSPVNAAIESALMVYVFATQSLGFSGAYFQVNKTNTRVCVFHERFGAVRVAEDLTQYEYEISNSAIQASIERYRRYLPHHIRFEETI